MRNKILFEEERLMQFMAHLQNITIMRKATVHIIRERL